VKLSLAIPNFNRSNEVIRSFSKVIDDDRIFEVVICDDESNSFKYNELVDLVDRISNKKIKINRNETNKGAYWNKINTVSKCQTDWCVLLDSDNQIDIDYLNRITDRRLDDKVIYAPDVARCSSEILNYKSLAGKTFDKQSIKALSVDPKSYVLLNTGNYVVNKDEYCRIGEMADHSINSYACDVLYFNYLWMNEGNYIHVVPDMSYEHALSNDSHYVRNSNQSQIFANIIRYKIENEW